MANKLNTPLTSTTLLAQRGREFELFKAAARAGVRMEAELVDEQSFNNMAWDMGANVTVPFGSKGRK